MANPALVGEEYNGPTDQLTPRQQELEWMWRFYRCTNYTGRRVSWDGGQEVGRSEYDAFLAQGPVVPPGFYDAGHGTPLKFRKPTAPYHLGKVIVNRFTSLLFGKKRSPKIVSDDPVTEDWLQGVVEATHLWSTMIRVRTFGGAMGSVGLSFRFKGGAPVVEVHDPRYCEPTFEDVATGEVRQLEKRFQFPEMVRDADGGVSEEWFWYRRVITRETDTVWPKVRATDEEPDWACERYQEREHGFGFCPVVWIQNQPVTDDIDGDPDCHGIFDLIEAIDTLYAQAHRGTIANCDPTLWVSSDAEFDELEKGSGKAIQTEKGGAVHYLEMTGGGVDRAINLAEKLEQKALTVARCMLDRNEGGPSRTAEEVEHNYSSMIEQADIYREQYGEHGVQRLLEMVLRAARQLATPRRAENAQGLPYIGKSLVKLPKRRVVTRGKVSWIERQVGSGERVELRWPDYFTPSQETVIKAVAAAGQAKQLGLVDAKNATEHVAPYFQIEDVDGVVKRAKEEQQQQEQPGGDVDATGVGAMRTARYASAV